ncbi:hypothetical protein CHS0354_003985 [Potamilus streckersoni]|uniref:Uncharacterized protein n=1 Tax=Potamilus streckersoni TaxID=2493646 RepID=A0AAE0S0K4_9BIVA|nr:hypothetical protein CHS0354_003985 [Potamilus streckersoni]
MKVSTTFRRSVQQHEGLPEYKHLIGKVSSHEARSDLSTGDIAIISPFSISTLTLVFSFVSTDSYYTVTNQLI